MNEEIDRMLSSEDSIVPSSGFAASVMEAVRREAEAPPPIPFPWKRALPGLACCVGALVAMVTLDPAENGASAEWSGWITRMVEAAMDRGVVWIAVAVIVSLASVALSISAANRRA